MTPTTERRKTPTESESLALMVLQQKGLIKSADAVRAEAREAKESAAEAQATASEAMEILIAMRAWQERHATETKPLTDAIPELLQVSESLRWINTGRKLVLWIGGGLIALSAFVAAIGALWDNYIRHWRSQ